MALVEFFQKESIQKKIYDIVNRLKHLGIEVALPKSKKLKSSSLIKAVLTGSPKNFGYNTKEEFIMNLILKKVHYQIAIVNILLLILIHLHLEK